MRAFFPSASSLAKAFRQSAFLKIILPAMLAVTVSQYAAAQCASLYTLNGSSSSASPTTGVYTAPSTGGPYLLKITAAGGRGGDGGAGTGRGGAGAVMVGTFTINAGQKLNVTAGGRGSGDGSSVGGGGGGSGVYIDGTSTILVIAGGGGGANYNGADGGVGRTTTDGETPSGGGTGGTNGTGGGAGYAGGGGGYTSAGGVFTASGQTASGGGAGFNATGGLNAAGSFSGGGGVGAGGAGYFNSQGTKGAGGGGGYSGGGASGQTTGGGGGGSINNGTSQTNTAGNSFTAGYVTIECLGSVCPSDNKIYVNAAVTSSGAGATWATAFKTLQEALALANTCTNITQIWVAKGTYYPDEAGTYADNDRNAAFVMKNNLAIYGGFAGTETELIQRNWKLNVTILSGDIDKDGIVNNGNSYNVIRNGNSVNNSALLNGVVITAGCANGPGLTPNNGGGVLNDGRNGICSPSFVNCTFRFNEAGSGAAVATHGSNGNCSSDFINCLFYGNKAIHNGSLSSGGVAYLQGGGNPVFTNCTFSGNQSSRWGGALYVSSNAGSPNVVMSNCILWGNTAAEGSQIYNFSSTTNISYSILQGGFAAIGNTGSFPVNNDNGSNSTADPSFVDAANSDFHLQGSSPAINKGTNTGAPSIDIEGTVRPRTVANPADMGAYEYVAPLTLSINDVTLNEGNTGTTSFTFTVSLSAPATQLVTANYFTANGTATIDDGDYIITAGSLIFTAGQQSKNITVLVNGDTKLEPDETFFINLTSPTNATLLKAKGTGTVVNEDCPAGTKLYVNATVASSGTGTNWGSAFKTLQEAITAANICSNVTQIWVAKGTYYPDEGGTYADNDRNASFAMKSNLAIYGGFAGTESEFIQRNLKLNATILSGDIDKDGVVNFRNSYNVIRNGNSINNTALLDGVVVTGGDANGEQLGTLSGGGVFNDGRSGICSPSFVNCTFRFNEAAFGGAVASYGSNGICSPGFVNCLFYANMAIHNSSSSNGGAVFLLGSGSPFFTNCTFSGNQALGSGGAMYLSSNAGSPNVLTTNCILWGNTAASGSQIFNFSSAINISYSILQGGFAAIGNAGSSPVNNDNGGNSSADPLFVNAANGNLHLQSGSPAIDAGTNTGAPSTDIEGTVRPLTVSNPADMGAYETVFPKIVSLTPNSARQGSNSVTVNIVGQNTHFANYDPQLGYGFTPDFGLGINYNTVSVTDATHASVNFHIAGNAPLGSRNVTITNGPEVVTLVNGFTITACDQVVTNTNNAGAGSLRQAVADACDGGTITFGPSVTDTIFLSGGQIVIDKNLTIKGPGATVLAVKNTKAGSTTSNIFQINAGKIVSISKLTVTGGKISDPSGNAMTGGGVDNQGTLTLDSMVVSGNTSIYGGGISNAGTLTVTNCTIAGNSGNNGGGIFARFGGSITLNRSTVSGNSASIGAGIYAVGNSTISNTSISGNTASVSAGAIFIPSGGVNSSLLNVTIVNNQSPVDGGISNTCQSCTVSITNTLIAGNTATNSSPDARGTFLSQGNNLVGKTDGSSGWVASDLTGSAATPVNAVTDTLANNGGFTQTHALLPGSPAINAGNNTGAPATDQRGIGRPQQSIVDIGAFESRGFSIVLSSGNNQTATVNTNFASPLVALVISSFSEPVVGGMVKFTPPASGASASIAVGAATISNTGLASSGTVTANATAGSYQVVASATGASSINFSLTNKALPTVFYVNDNSTSGDVFTTAIGNDATGDGSTTAPFRTISKALSVALATNTIYVDAGTYTEQVEINKAIRIAGAGAALTSIVSPATLPLSFTTSAVNKAIVYAHDATAVIIDSLTVDGAGNGNANFKFSGIAYRNASGKVQASAVKGIRNTLIDGAQGGYGIFAQADNGTAQTVNIVNNTVTDFQKNGLYLSGANLTTTVKGNTVTGAGAVDVIAQNGIVLLNNATGSIDSNYFNALNYTPANNTAAGILVFGASGNITTSRNVVNNVEAGIYYYNASGSITGNKINYTTTDAFVAGIEVGAGTFSVTANEISGNGKVAGIQAEVAAGETTNLTATNNKINNATEGFPLITDGGNGVINSTINFNSITGTAKAIHNYTTTNSAATCNWYGTSDPATISTMVTGPATIAPFLTNGTDTDPAAIGFQPVGNACTGQLICESPLVQPYIASTNTGNQIFRGELGLEFTVNAPVSVKQLGAFDDKGDGIKGLQPGNGVRVAIYSLTTHSIVQGLDATVVGLADAYTGNHRMKNITPVILQPGNYMIVAKGYNINEQNGNLGNGGGPYPEGDRGVNNAITFLNECAYGPDDPNGFNYPTVAGSFGSNHQFLAGSFAFVTSGPCAAASADLTNLVLTPAAALSPAFTSSTTAYTANVANNVASVTVTPTAFDAAATITVNGGAPVASGAVSAPIVLVEGSNNIAVVVTASDGTTTKTYTITVIKAASGQCTAPVAQAYSSNTSQGAQGYRGELGMEFIVNNANGIIINQLGAFDDGGNGITGLQSGGVRVAIFNRATHQQVSGLNTVISGTAGTLSGNHRLVDIAPITLPAGDYVIVAKGYNVNERNGNTLAGTPAQPTGNNGGGAISFGSNSSYGPDDPANFNYPSTEGNFGATQVFLAGTFNFTTVIPCGGNTTCESAPAVAYVSNTNMGSQPYQGELGMQFIVNNPAGINIKQLGAFDDKGDGITGTQSGGVRVVVFNRSTQKIVPGLDVVISGNADAYTSFHRMKNITPVLLPMGDYTLVAKGYNVNERNGNIFSGGGPFPAGDNANGAITFGAETLYGPDDANGFNYPTNTGNFGDTHVFLAGTFNFTANVSCPSGAPVATRVIANATTGEIKPSALGIQEIKAYPNPTRGQFRLQLTNVTAPKLKIDILNASGQLITQKTVAVLTCTALLNVEFNMLNQAPGIYMIKVQSSDGVKTEKLVIQR